jgi:Uma2 family endonuclease
MTAVSDDWVALPSRLHLPLSIDEYRALPEDVGRDTELVDGMLVMSPKPSRRHNRIGRRVAAALESAGAPRWAVETNTDVRLRAEPALVREPDVVVYRGDIPDDDDLLAGDVVLVVEIVPPGSQTVDRKHKPEYAEAGIPYFWRVEMPRDGVPVVHTYALDEGSNNYQATATFIGVVDVVAPFPISVDLMKE